MRTLTTLILGLLLTVGVPAGVPVDAPGDVPAGVPVDAPALDGAGTENPAAAISGPESAPPRAPEVGPVPEAVRRRLRLDDFYQKHIDAGGLPVVGSAAVSDHALLEAAWIVSHMLAKRPDILAAMGERGARLVVMVATEYTTDLPEQRRMEPKVFWDRRARGLGGSRRNPIVSCAEENLLCLKGDPYSTENILVHEFAHAIHGIGLDAIDPSFEGKLRAAHENAKAKGLWPRTYAITNPGEYWAEAVQSWFDTNRQNDALHCHVDTREELEEYDPEMAGLIREVLGESPWRYRKPMAREPEGRAHLAGFDPATAPAFRWREAPVPESPRVRIETTAGAIVLELDARMAPLTTANFLRYVHEGLYADGAFFRAVGGEIAESSADTAEGAAKAGDGGSETAERAARIAFVQARANPEKREAFPPPIPLERTRDTRLRHLDGAVSMARAEPDSAQDSFFIAVGDQPELDFGGRRNPDGQGFAVFGRVVEGMDVVRKIHASKAEGEDLTPPIGIQRAIRLN